MQFGIIENLEITTLLLKQDFYNWSENRRKKFTDPDIALAMDAMKLHGIVPGGWGSYISSRK